MPDLDLGPGLSEHRILKPRTLHHGTMVTADMAAARQFYQQFLGLTCTRVADRMLVYLQSADGSDSGCRIDVREVAAVERPQNILNHWGIDVPSVEDVDRIHAAAEKLKQQYGLRRIMAARMQHGVYGFYLQDRDSNWWEIQYTDPQRSHHRIFAAGDQYPD